MPAAAPSRPAALVKCPPPWLNRVQTFLLVALLALMVARTTLTESPYSRRPLADAGAFESLPVGAQIQMPNELARVGAAAAIAMLAAAWALAGFFAGRLEIHRPLIGLWIAAIIASLFASAAGAMDKREALTTAAEQASLLAAGWLMIQLARPAWRQRLVLIVLVGLAGLQGAKGLYQVGVEIPDTLANWQAQQNLRLTAANQTAQSPDYRLLEARVVERTTKGYFSLANPYGSMMIVLLMAAGGLAAEKWQRWRTQRTGSATVNGRAPPQHGDVTASAAAGRRPAAPPRGRISLGLLAAALTTLLATAAALSLALTHSKGAIAAGAVAVAVAVVVWLCRSWARRHGRALAAAAVSALVLAVAATALYGAHRGGLPSRSMQVRWEYWVASAEILRQHPLLGVGPGNFPDAYLANRLSGAEESVKNPHNVIVQAFSEYGLIGGTLFVGLLLWVLARITAPAAPAGEDPAQNSPHGGGAVALLLGIVLAVLAWRLWVMTYPDAFVAIYDNSLLVLMLVPSLLIAAWTGRSLRAGLLDEGGLNVLPAIALGCGLWGYALHNLTDFALFLPGAAMVFHIVVGTMLASKGGRTFVLSRLPAASVSAALAAAALSLAVLLLGPAIAKHSAIIEAAEACSTGQLAAGQAALARAVAADPLDAGPAADQAALLLRAAQQEMSQPRAELLLQRAIEAMTLAVERQPMHAGYRHELLELRVFQRECSLLWGRWYNPPPDLPAARKEVASLLREQPDNPGLLNIAAQYAYQASDFDAAAAYMDRASRITSWPILLDHLGDIRWAAGDAQAAAALWRTFQQDRRGRFELTDPAFAQAAGQIVDLDRQNARQQLDLAQLAWQAGQLDQVAPLLDATQAADAALPPLVVMRLTAAEKAQIALLRQKLTAAGG